MTTSSQASWHFTAWVLYFFCLVSFVTTVYLGLSWGGLILFVVISALYMASVRLRFQNEVESAFVCTVILVLIVALIPAYREVLNAAQRSPTENSQEMTPTKSQLPIP